MFRGKPQGRLPTFFTILKIPSQLISSGNFLRLSELFVEETEGAKPWVSEKAHYCGYWASRSPSLSCLLFLCITDNGPADGGC
jgi:hypothetical protein